MFLCASYGTAVSLFLPAPVSAIVSLVWPDDFSWERFNELEIIDAKEERPIAASESSDKKDHDLASPTAASLSVEEKEDQVVLAEKNLAEAKSVSFRARFDFQKEKCERS